MKWVLNRHCSKEKIKWLINMRRGSGSPAIKEMQIKTTVRFHVLPIQKSEDISVGKDVGERVP